MIRVVVADDHHLVRQGIRALLEKTGEVEVVGEAADGQDALELVQQTRPDVLLIDVAMPRLNGLETVRRLQGLGVKTRALVLSMHSDTFMIRQALRYGAAGYLLKRALKDELRLAVQAVSRGETFLGPEISGPLLASFSEFPVQAEPADPLSRLTPRERELLQLVAEGNTNAAIADTLGISEKTVEKHRANLMAKLPAHDLAGLIRFALKYGLIRLDG